MPPAPKQHWYKQEKDEQHVALTQLVAHLRENQSYLTEENKLHASLYGNVELDGLGVAATARITRLSQRVTRNIIANGCDSTQARICKNKVRPMFLTEDGDFSQQRRAKDLGKFVKGVFHHGGFWDVGKVVALDGMVLGTGCLHPYLDEVDNQIKAERVFIDEIWWDEEEARYGEPRQIFRCKYVAREVLLELYADAPADIKGVIATAPKAEPKYGAPNGGPTDQLLVIEGWHLPSGPKAKDGVHAIVIDGATLRSEPYTRKRFPFVFYRWRRRMLGFRGQGLAERLMPAQVAINKLLRRTQASIEIMGMPWVFVEEGSKVTKSELRNEIGAIIQYRGTPPTRDVSPAIHPQIIDWIDRLEDGAYRQEGISQTFSQSTKPAGLDSGKALREYNDQESERMVINAQDWEAFFMEAAEHVVELGRVAFERDKKFGVNVPGSKFIEKIKWSEVSLDDDQFVMQVFPTSFLPSTPAGKLQSIQELLASGMLTKEQGMSLLDYPDLEAVNSLINAPIEDIKAQIEEMIDDGLYFPPEPFQQLDLGITMMGSAYLRAKRDGVPEERLELLRRWIEDAKDLLNPPQDPAAAADPAAAMGAAPPGPGPGMAPPMEALAGAPMDAGALPMAAGM